MEPWEDTTEPRKCYNSLLAQKLIEELKKRNMEGFYCETKEDALKKVLEMIPKLIGSPNIKASSFRVVVDKY